MKNTKNSLLVRVCKGCFGLSGGGKLSEVRGKFEDLVDLIDVFVFK